VVLRCLRRDLRHAAGVLGRTAQRQRSLAELVGTARHVLTNALNLRHTHPFLILNRVKCVHSRSLTPPRSRDRRRPGYAPASQETSSPRACAGQEQERRSWLAPPSVILRQCASSHFLVLRAGRSRVRSDCRIGRNGRLLGHVPGTHRVRAGCYRVRVRIHWVHVRTCVHVGIYRVHVRSHRVCAWSYRARTRHRTRTGSYRTRARGYRACAGHRARARSGSRTRTCALCKAHARQQAQHHATNNQFPQAVLFPNFQMNRDTACKHGHIL
jgi:hypothetical protein